MQCSQAAELFTTATKQVQWSKAHDLKEDDEEKEEEEEEKEESVVLTCFYCLSFSLHTGCCVKQPHNNKNAELDIFAAH